MDTITVLDHNGPRTVDIVDLIATLPLRPVAKIGQGKYYAFHVTLVNGWSFQFQGDTALERTLLADCVSSVVVNS